MEYTAYIRTESDLWTFLRTTSCKRYIREVVQDEVFLQKIRDSHNLGANIQNIIRSESLSIIPQLTTNHLNSVLGGMVSEKISQSLPTFLNNNIQMQNILDRHAGQMKNTLQVEAEDIISKTVRDSKFHTVNSRYFQAFAEKGDTVLATWKRESSATLAQQNDKIQALEVKCSNYEKRITASESNLKLLSFSVVIAIGVAATAVANYSSSITVN